MPIARAWFLIVMFALPSCREKDSQRQPVDHEVIASGERSIPDFGIGYSNPCYLGLVKNVTGSRSIEDIFDEFLPGGPVPEVDEDLETWVIFNDHCPSGGYHLSIEEMYLADDFLRIDLTNQRTGGGSDFESLSRQFIVLSLNIEDVAGAQGMAVNVEPLQYSDSWDSGA